MARLGEDGMKALLRVPVAIWRGTRRVFGLIRDDRDVRAIYGDNPNGVSEEERALNAGVISNTAMNTWGM
jgi:hypothetical protein